MVKAGGNPNGTTLKDVQVEFIPGLADPQKNLIYMISVYMTCTLLGLLLILGGIFSSRNLRKGVKNIFYIMCCLYICAGGKKSKRDEKKETDSAGECTDDDSEDEFFCFNMKETARVGKLRTIRKVELDKVKAQGPEHLQTGVKMYNFKRKGDVLKVRLEFLSDLASFMTNQCPKTFESDNYIEAPPVDLEPPPERPQGSKKEKKPKKEKKVKEPKAKKEKVKKEADGGSKERKAREKQEKKEQKQKIKQEKKARKEQAKKEKAEKKKKKGKGKQPDDIVQEADAM